MDILGEEEVPMCRFCLVHAELFEPIISPCKCAGTQRYIHTACLERWLQEHPQSSCLTCRSSYRRDHEWWITTMVYIRLLHQKLRHSRAKIAENGIAAVVVSLLCQLLCKFLLELRDLIPGFIILVVVLEHLSDCDNLWAIVRACKSKPAAVLWLSLKEVLPTFLSIFLQMRLVSFVIGRYVYTVPHPRGHWRRHWPFLRPALFGVNLGVCLIFVPFKYQLTFTSHEGLVEYVPHPDVCEWVEMSAFLVEIFVLTGKMWLYALDQEEERLM